MVVSLIGLYHVLMLANESQWFIAIQAFGLLSLYASKGDVEKAAEFIAIGHQSGVMKDDVPILRTELFAQILKQLTENKTLNNINK